MVISVNQSSTFNTWTGRVEYEINSVFNNTVISVNQSSTFNTWTGRVEQMEEYRSVRILIWARW